MALSLSNGLGAPCNSAHSHPPVGLSEAKLPPGAPQRRLQVGALFRSLLVVQLAHTLRGNSRHFGQGVAMRVSKQSLRKIVKVLNNAEEDGGFWLPNIQRPFVWTEDQTCRLFDSIMREYPISTLLVWKTKAEVKCRKFIDNYRATHSAQLSHFFVPINAAKKGLVLDGQQRLQSLFIGLCGSYEGKELYLNMLSGEASAPEDIKYQFAFRANAEDDFDRIPLQFRKGRARAYWVKFKDIVFSTRDPVTEAQKLLRDCPLELDDAMRSKVSAILGQAFKTFHSDEGIVYQELDSIENADLYSEDDVVEVFIRANSGGTILGKSDLLFSLLSASWDQSNEAMESLLEDLNRSGFAFDRDFVLKACLVILDRGARYEVNKFRHHGVREEIEEMWAKISESIKDVADRLQSETYIRCDKALPSYNVLMPLIYFRFHNKALWPGTKDLGTYILRTSLSGTFNSSPDQLIDDIVEHLRKQPSFVATEVLEFIRNRGKSVELSEERLWEQGYGSKSVHLIFNLLYRDFNYSPLFDGNMPQVDHIFPQSELKRVRMRNPESGRNTLMKYKKPERDQLANCMLLTAFENGFTQKNDTSPQEWFADKSAKYLEAHLIPTDQKLWTIDSFEAFVEARKLLIRERLKDFLLVRADGVLVS
ncbi:MAG: DUF262 domain-containing protein [Caulobacterales bacterium]